jgi:hypothetical protein
VVFDAGTAVTSPNGTSDQLQPSVEVEQTGEKKPMNDGDVAQKV